MAILKNQRHELFAVGIASGKSQGEAYTAAGYTTSTPETAWVGGSKLVKNAKVAARIAELQTAVHERAVEKTGITKARILAELAKIGFANMLDYVKVGSDGDPYVDFSVLTREQAAAIGEVVVEDFKDGRGEDARDVRRVRFKLLDKKGALVDLGKELGMFVTRTEVGEPGDFANKTDDELQREIAAISRRARVRRPRGDGTETPEEPESLH